MKQFKVKSTVVLFSIYGMVMSSETVLAQATTGVTELDTWLQNTINVLSALVMAAFVISMIIAGIQYMTARDNASQVSAAKDRIVTIAITFPLFIFGYALLQWLIPGGIF